MITLKLTDNNDSIRQLTEDLTQINSLKIDLDKLVLINPQSDDDGVDLNNNRLTNYGVIIRVLSSNDFRTFLTGLGDQKRGTLEAKGSFKRLLDPKNHFVINISSSRQPKQEQICSYLAIRNENNSDRIRELITNPDFLTSSSAINWGIDFFTLQSLLMHNKEGIVGLQTIEGLTSEQDEKKNIVLRNVAIASLINPNLHDQAKEILNGFHSTQFDDQDKESIKNSFKFLTAQIEKSISENQDEKLLKQFDILVKNLQIYGEKLDITIEVPNKIMDAIKIRQNADQALLDPAKFPLKEGSSELVAEVLLGDNQKDIINLSVLKTLKEGARIGGASASLVSNTLAQR